MSLSYFNANIIINTNKKLLNSCIFFFWLHPTRLAFQVGIEFCFIYYLNNKYCVEDYL